MFLGASVNLVEVRFPHDNLLRAKKKESSGKCQFRNSGLNFQLARFFFPRNIRRSTGFIRSVLLLVARHRLVGKEVKNAIIIDEMNPFGMKPDKVSAVFATVTALTGFDAKQVGISTIDAFSQRNTDFGYSNIALVADGEKVFALAVMLAAL
jgi:hypothetical protein